MTLEDGMIMGGGDGRILFWCDGIIRLIMGGRCHRKFA
jgi:hypothetical protein